MTEKVMIGSAELRHGDCLDMMASIPGGSVDMILCDLPYGTMLGAGLDGWSKDETYWDVCIDHQRLTEEYNRVLRTNGAIVLFSQGQFTIKLMTETHSNLPFSYRYTWVKDHFANALIAKKAPVNYTEDVCVFFKKYDTFKEHALREYAKHLMSFIGKNIKDIGLDLGHKKAERLFSFNSIQFKLCTEETYSQLIDIYGIDRMKWFKSYEELRAIDDRFARRFNLPENSKFKSNVLNYKKDYQGLHPTQKPVKLLEDLIKTYTHKGETVLDNCMGSGSTGVACLNTGRGFIGIERDDRYFETARNRIEAHSKQQQ